MKYEIVGRRMCDVEKLYADPSLALRELNWKASRGLEEMCEYHMTSSHALLSSITVSCYARHHICYSAYMLSPVVASMKHILALTVFILGVRIFCQQVIIMSNA